MSGGLGALGRAVVSHLLRAHGGSHVLLVGRRTAAAVAPERARLGWADGSRVSDDPTPYPTPYSTPYPTPYPATTLPLVPTPSSNPSPDPNPRPIPSPNPGPNQVSYAQVDLGGADGAAKLAAAFGAFLRRASDRPLVRLLHLAPAPGPGPSPSPSPSPHPNRSLTRCVPST